jgi:hypothetical protein
VPSDSAAEHFFCGVEGAYRNVAGMIDACINVISTKRDPQTEYLPLSTSPTGPSGTKGLAVKIG